MLIVVTYLSIPVSTLILVGAMQNVDRGVLENARDLGAGGLRTVTSVLVPLTMTGIVASLAYGFVVISGDYITPQLVGGTTGQMIGVPISDQFLSVGNEPLGSALSFLMLAVFVIVYLVLTSWRGSRGCERRCWRLRRRLRRRGIGLLHVYVGLLLLFLFLPLAVLILFSFAASGQLRFPITGLSPPLVPGGVRQQHGD